MKRLFYFLVFICISIFSYPLSASNITDLEKIEVDKFEGIGPVTFHYNSKTCRILMEDISVIDYVQDTLVAECSLLAKGKDLFKLEYSSGPSVDPSFTIVGLYGGRDLSGTDMAIPGDGFFYVWGHTNSLFNKRRMYTIKENKVVEAQTPYYYVGQESEVLMPISLYRSRNLEDRIISIPKGETVEIILKDGSYYLLKTSMDILGWWKPANPIGPGLRELKSLYFAGD